MLAAAAGLAPEAPIRIIAELNDVPFAWRELRNEALTSADRQWTLSVRKEQTGRLTGPLATRLRDMGATGISEFWLSPGFAATVRAQDVAAIAAWPEILDIAEDRVISRPMAYSAGLDAADGMGTRHFITAGFTGYNRGRWGQGQRVGVMEVPFMGDSFNRLNANHYGFGNLPGYPGRVQAINVCTTGTCVVNMGSVSTFDTHGTWVTQIMAGDVENYQDPGVTDPTERRRRSGVAPGAEIYYYEVGGICSAKVAGLNQAAADGVDVLNMSFTIQCTPTCARRCDICPGVNSAITNLTDAGGLTVTALGNSTGPTPTPVGTCDAAYPALRRDGLAVAGLDSANAGQAPVPYESQAISDRPQDSSARGGMTVRLAVGGTEMPSAFAIADLAAPAAYETFWYGSPPNGYTSRAIHGTSLAAAAVTGAAALLRDAGNAAGLGLNDARALLVNMLLMGNGYAYDQAGPNWVWPHGFDPRSGAGRVHMHYPADLVQPAGWGWHRFVMTSGQVATFPVWSTGPEDPAVQQWKAAMTWVESDYASVADIIFTVVDTCPQGGGPPVQLLGDYSYDIRKRLMLLQNQIAGKCLEGRVTAYGIPAGQTRVVYVADYFHSEVGVIH